nr:MAG TPA: nucleic-acid-binding protein [Inoviridae sp.]
MKKFWISFIALLLGVAIGVGIWQGIVHKDKIKVFAESAWSKIESAFKKDNKQDEQNPTPENPNEEISPAYYGFWGKYDSEDKLTIYKFSKDGIIDFEGFVKDNIVYAKDIPNGAYACSAQTDEEKQVISFVWGKNVSPEIAFVYDIEKNEMRLVDNTLLVRLENVEKHVCQFEWTITKEATCSESGSKHGICSICGETCDSEIAPAHSYVVEECVKQEDGYYLVTYVCSNCGDKIQRVEARPIAIYY